MITGDSGNGLTHGVLGATIIRDLIQNKSNPWQAVYDPSRLSMKAIKNAIINLSKSTKGYAGYISPGKISSANELAANEGAVMREKLAKVAVYRDEEGRVYKFSAICPHLKAIITWNSIDKTWDCPAHGSRFSAKGKLLNRPATCDLKCLYKPSI